MLILLYGKDDFRLKEKLKEIISGYQAKHKSGLNLSVFEEADLSMDKVKLCAESVSMFDEKKLIALKNIFNNNVFYKELSEYITKKKIKNNQDVILVICHEGKIPDANFKRKANMFEEFKPFQGSALVEWAKKRTGYYGAKINNASAYKLAGCIGNDLWRLNNEIGKLASYKTGGVIEPEDIDLMVRGKIDANIFQMLDALAQKNKDRALLLLHNHLARGENEFYLLTMFIYQWRNLIKIKDLIERKTPIGSIAKQAGIHPFVVKKTVPQLNNFSLEQLKNIYRRLLDMECKIKTGQIDSRAALDMFIAGI